MKFDILRELTYHLLIGEKLIQHVLQIVVHGSSVLILPFHTSVLLTPRLTPGPVLQESPVSCPESPALLKHGALLVAGVASILVWVLLHLVWVLLHFVVLFVRVALVALDHVQTVALGKRK